MAIESTTIDIGNGREIKLETGKMALLAHGSLTVQQGETVVMIAACSSDPRPGLDFFPLQVDYREKFTACGKLPGGYFKREGRPSEKEILTARMTDRPMRPLFPEGYIDDVQIQALLLSTDQENEADVLSILGASAALALSDMPFNGPVGALRVGRVNGEFIANPTHSEMEKSDLDLVYAGVEDRVIMIEGACDELTEEELRDALVFANDVAKKLIAGIKDLASRAGREKKTPNLTLVPDAILEAVKAASEGKLEGPCTLPNKEERYGALDALLAEVKEEIGDKFDEEYDNAGMQIKNAFTKLTKQTIRTLLVEQGLRSDGRAADKLRNIDCQVGTIPRVHGSALFARGETQALVLTTLGPEGESQDFDGITGGPTSKTFYLHYNFPNYSVGETGRIMGPGRREIGHGALAERCVARMMPDDFPYAVRCVSEVMGSNGSTSMASICGASLSLMEAGVPLKKPVAGISCGLVREGGKDILLTDILGSEDHYGDMDFKVAGTPDGITGFQLDLKIDGISIELMYEAMLRNKTARFEILDSMNACMPAARDEVSPNAPRMEIIKINPEKIGALIGPGGKVIRGLTAEYDVQIDIEDDGSVKVFGANKSIIDAGVEAVMGIVAEVEVGKIYRGKVQTVKDFGAFVEVLPGQDGLLHISEMADYRVESVADICAVGDVVSVKVIDIDERGRIRLSRRAALAEMDV